MFDSGQNQLSGGTKCGGISAVAGVSDVRFVSLDCYTPRPSLQFIQVDRWNWFPAWAVGNRTTVFVVGETVWKAEGGKTQSVGGDAGEESSVGAEVWCAGTAGWVSCIEVSNEFTAWFTGCGDLIFGLLTGARGNSSWKSQWERSRRNPRIKQPGKKKQRRYCSKRGGLQEMLISRIREM